VKNIVQRVNIVPLSYKRWSENFFDDKDWKSVFKSHPGFFACDIFFKSPTAELSGVEIAQEIQQRYEKSRPFMILGSFWGSLSRDLDRMVSEGILVMDGRTKKYSKKT
jgi:hypothetical protein